MFNHTCIHRVSISFNLFRDAAEQLLCYQTFDFSFVKKLLSTVPALPGPALSKSMSQMSSCAESLSLFFFFLEGSSGGFSRDSSSDLLMSEVERTVMA